MEVSSCNDGFTEQETLIFSVCSETIKKGEVKNDPLDQFLTKNSLQKNIKSASFIHPTQFCETSFEHHILHDNFQNLNTNNTNNTFFSEKKFSETDRSQIESNADNGINASAVEPTDSSSCNFSRQCKKPLKGKSQRSRLKKPSDANRPKKNGLGSFFLCEIGGSTSSPRIQRVFTNHSRAFLMKVLKNSVENDFQVVSDTIVSLQDVLNNLLLVERYKSNCSVNADDTNLTEPDSSSDENFSHLIEVIESDLEDSVLPVKKFKRERLSSIEETTEVPKEQTNDKISKMPAKIWASNSKKKNILPSAAETSEASKGQINIKLSKRSSEIKASNSKNLRRKSEATVSGLSLLSETSHKEDLPVSKNKKKINLKKVLSFNTADKANQIRFECDVCLNTFSTKYSLRDHILAKHPPSTNCRPFICDKCPQAFVRKSSLNEHMKMTHSDCPKFPCLSCPKVFKRQLYLQYHMLRTHWNSKKYLCQHCGAGFGLIFALNEHVKYHHSEEVLKCNDCHKVYKTAKSLVIHSKPRLQGPKPTCRYCKETFINLCSLQLHLQRAHENVHKFSCRSCEVKFTQKKCLVSHMKHVHQADRNYPCPLCKKCFKNPAAVRVHLSNIHNQEKNFECEFCYSSFKTRQTYNEHKAFKHPM